MAGPGSTTLGTLTISSPPVTLTFEPAASTSPPPAEIVTAPAPVLLMVPPNNSTVPPVTLVSVLKAPRLETFTFPLAVRPAAVRLPPEMSRLSRVAKPPATTAPPVMFKSVAVAAPVLVRLPLATLTAAALKAEETTVPPSTDSRVASGFKSASTLRFPPVALIALTAIDAPSANVVVPPVTLRLPPPPVAALSVSEEAAPKIVVPSVSRFLSSARAIWPLTVSAPPL